MTTGRQFGGGGTLGTEMSPSRGKREKVAQGSYARIHKANYVLERLWLTPQLYNLVQSIPSFPFPSPQGLQLPATSMLGPSQTLRSN